MREKKAKSTKKEKQASRTTDKPSKRKRGKQFVSDEEVGSGPGPRPVGGSGGPPISIGVGLGGFGRGPMRPGGGAVHPAGPTGPVGGQRIR